MIQSTLPNRAICPHVGSRNIALCISLRHGRNPIACLNAKYSETMESTLVEKNSSHHFSDTALDTPASGTSVHSLSGLYSFIAVAIREVFSPRFC
jgi:hypothetical protein